MAKLLKTVVIFGGASSEHDVSVVSAHQLMDAVDVRKIEVLPVYTDFANRFWMGASLRDIATYRPRPPLGQQVTFRWGDNGPMICAIDGTPIETVDCVLPVFHGTFGEDGRIQAYFELLGIPVTGLSASSTSIAMRKDVTKALVKAAGVNVLPHVTVDHERVHRPNEVISEVKEQFGFPVIVKPANLGSSVGVGLAKSDNKALWPLVEYVLKKDTLALIEPQVQNLVEYNIAMIAKDGAIKFSAIERPKSGAELLDFREKYLSADGGTKGSFKPSEGMLSLTRDINPDIPDELKARIYDYAAKTFTALGKRGAPRIDFMCNSETGELWFNEINAIPGSYGFFLWEAAAEPMLFPELVKHLVDEATGDTIKTFEDPVPQDARLLQRR
ncbi:MAG: D-alanine--D-alanine ligase [Pseudomonadota bacterium]